MQSLSLEFIRTFCRTINLIAQNWMSDTGHMNTDLMCPTGFKLALNVGKITKSFQYTVMSDCMSAEATTTELSKAHQPEGFSESQKIARRGGSYAGQVRQDIEKDTGRPVITSQNAAQLNAVVVDMIESVAETEKPDNDENK